MDNTNNAKKIYFVSLILLVLFAITFVATMGFLNYKTTAIELEKEAIARVEKDNVAGIETAVSFGKSFENYYGMEDVFNSFSELYPGPVPFVIDLEGKLLYLANTDNARQINGFLDSSEFKRELPNLYDKEGTVIESGSDKVVFTNIHRDEDVIGYFGAIYQDKMFNKSFSNVRRSTLVQSLIIAFVLAVFMFTLLLAMGRDRTENLNKVTESRNIRKMTTIVMLFSSILAVSVMSIYSFQNDYRDRIEKTVRISLMNLQNQIENVSSQGVDLRDVDGLQDYIQDRILSLNTLHAVSISEKISEVNVTDEESEIITFAFGGKDKKDSVLTLQAEISNEMVTKEMRSIIMLLLSTMIILLIFVFELNSLIDLSIGARRKRANVVDFDEKQVSLALRFTGFLCSTAEYMCVPYAAMMIRSEGTALFGLSVGLTAALPLTLEGLSQMVGMLTLPKIVKKLDIKSVLIISTIVMALSNFAAFALGGALTIIICRTIAGFAYSGFKQVSNYLITRGYETDKGRSDNISQDNAGLLAGATCGAGLGAILSANAGYAMTFFLSGILFLFYLAGTYFLIPWDSLAKRAGEEEEEKPVSIPAILKMFTSFEMIMFILFVAIPLNIGVMLCVTLIPAICQTNGTSSVVLSYCYIANGLAGIYIGPALVSRAKAKFGLQPCLAFTFAITAFSIFILKLPMVTVVIIVSSMILGFLDGFGTPMATDRFMSLDVVTKEVDESTALIFFVVLCYVLLSFAPMIAELMLLPGEGFANPMLIGAVLYVVAAVVIMFMRRKKAKA